MDYSLLPQRGCKDEKLTCLLVQKNGTFLRLVFVLLVTTTFEIIALTHLQKDFPKMYERKKEKRIQTVDQMLRSHEKTEAKVNTNPRILAGTKEAINKFVADRQGIT